MPRAGSKSASERSITCKDDSLHRLTGNIVTQRLRPYRFDVDLGVLGMLRSRKAGVLGVALASAAALFLASLPSLTAHRAVLPKRCRRRAHLLRVLLPSLNNLQALIVRPLTSVHPSDKCIPLSNKEAAGGAHIPVCT